MPRKGTYARLYATGKPRGGSKKGSHANAGARERAHMGWDGRQGNSKARQRANINRWEAAARKHANKPRGRISVIAVARFLEFGTSKMSKRPFMTQAFETKKTEAMNVIISGIKEALKL
jgi:HK97 gp10 family phage protein